MADLHKLRRPRGATRPPKRVGRGPGSGHGKTSGRGHKGAKARTGSGGPGGGKPFFEGGQMPLYRRVPKRGFHPLERKEYQVVNLWKLEENLSADVVEVTPAVLAAHGLVRDADKPVKILGTGELRRSLRVVAHAVSASARTKIEKVGGSVELLG